jgi:hypothetical protein
MRRIAAGLTAAALSAATLLSLGGSSGAAPPNDGPGGQATSPSTDGSTLGVRAEVRLTGDLRSGGGTSSATVSVPPTCWWESTSMDANQFKDYYDSYMRSINYGNGGGPSVYADWGQPMEADVQAAVDRQNVTGAPLTWYRFQCQHDTGYEEKVGLNRNPLAGREQVPAIYQPVAAGDPVPAAAVGVADLRDVAQEYLRLLPPVLKRSPQVGLPAIARLPTWLWATPDDVKTKLVRAEVPGVWAQVRADSTGIEFAATAADPARVNCVDAAALVAYQPGMAEDDSTCTLTFPNASGVSGQFAVTATNVWFADWHSSVDGAFQPVPQQPAPQVTTMQLQVAETQTVVTR